MVVGQKRKTELSIEDQLALERGLRAEAAATRLKAGGITMENHGLYSVAVDDFKSRLGKLQRSRDATISHDPLSYVTAFVTAESFHSYVDPPPIDEVIAHGWASRQLMRVASVSSVCEEVLRAYHGSARDRVANYRVPGSATVLNRFVCLVPFTKSGRKILDARQKEVQKATSATGLADELGTIMSEFSRQNKSRKDKARQAMAVGHAMELYREACVVWNAVNGGRNAS